MAPASPSQPAGSETTTNSIYTLGRGTQKLVSIRRRTDQDLLVLVNRELDRGVTLVDLATDRKSPLFVQAEKAYDTVRTILPRISDLSKGDHLHLEWRLKELRFRLDQVVTFARVERYPALFAS